VDLSKPFIDPVVVATAVSYHDAALVVVKIHQTDTTGFELRLQPWDESNRSHASEAVGYLAIERGRFRSADGAALESGTVDTDPAYPVHSIVFSQPFWGIAVVMTGLVNTQGPMAVTGRPTLISEKEFQFQLQPQGPSASLGALQTVTYVAWEPSIGTFVDLAFEVNKTQSVIRWQFSTLKFKEIFPEAPMLLADVQSSQGGSPINVRRERKDLGSVDLKINDAPDLNAEGVTSQDTDIVGHIVIRYCNSLVGRTS
jgi:hypothetical protein